MPIRRSGCVCFALELLLLFVPPLNEPPDLYFELGDAETQKQLGHSGVGKDLTDQQVGNAWVGTDSIVSLSMGGDLNVYDRRQARPKTEGEEAGWKPTRIIHVSEMFPFEFWPDWHFG